MAAVAFACESQSTRSVRWSAAARQDARFTAVVVFPTPPFWFATAMIRANPRSPKSAAHLDLVAPCCEKLAKSRRLRKLFHVEQSSQLWKNSQEGSSDLFHVEHSPILPILSALVLPAWPAPRR